VFLLKECMSLLKEMLQISPNCIRILQFDEFLLFKDTQEDFSFLEDTSSGLDESIKDLNF